jgi:hypothetical protein
MLSPWSIFSDNVLQVTEGFSKSQIQLIEDCRFLLGRVGVKLDRFQIYANCPIAS